jgi:hypothetical protein
MPLETRTPPVPPEWFESFLLGRGQDRKLEVDGSVEDIVRVLGELLVCLGWRRIVSVRSASAVLVFRKPFQILRVHASPVVAGRTARTCVDMERVRMC